MFHSVPGEILLASVSFSRQPQLFAAFEKSDKTFKKLVFVIDAHFIADILHYYFKSALNLDSQ